MKRANTKIDLENDTTTVYGLKSQMGCNSVGHFYLPIIDEKEAWKKTLKILWQDPGVYSETCFVYTEEVSSKCVFFFF